MDDSLDMVDDSDGSCTHHLSLRKGVFGEAEAEKLAENHVKLMQVDAVQPEIVIGMIKLAAL